MKYSTLDPLCDKSPGGFPGLEMSWLELSQGCSAASAAASPPLQSLLNRIICTCSENPGWERFGDVEGFL